MKRSGRMAAWTLALALIAGLAFSQPATAKDKVYTLKYQFSYPPTLSFYKTTGVNFIKLVEKWSHGRIKFQRFEAGAVASVPDMLNAVNNGVLDVSQSWGGFYVGVVPEADVETGLPLAWDEAYEVYDAYYNRGLLQVIQNAYESRFNVKYFPAIISMKYAISTTKPVHHLSELKGMKLRAIGVYGEFAQALGAAATVIPGAELYTALQLGTIDGLIYDTEACVATGLEKFFKTSIVKPNLNAGAGQWVINKKTWDSLPKDLQEVIENVVQYGNMASAMTYRASAEMSLGKMKKAGVELVALPDKEVDEARNVAIKLWDKVASRTEGAAKGVAIVKQQLRDYGHLME
jgi:TRAP-type C4-dicarboxylate transport system substrate-binding protein